MLAAIVAVMAALGAFTLLWHCRPAASRERSLGAGLAILLVVLLEAMFLVGTGYGISDPRHDFRWELLWSATAQIDVGGVLAGVALGRGRVWRRIRHRAAG